MPCCKLCKKKIAILFKDAYTCRCKRLFCREHLQNHDCPINYNDIHISQAKKRGDMKIVAPAKVAII